MKLNELIKLDENAQGFIIDQANQLELKASDLARESPPAAGKLLKQAKALRLKNKRTVDKYKKMKSQFTSSQWQQGVADAEEWIVDEVGELDAEGYYDSAEMWAEVISGAQYAKDNG